VTSSRVGTARPVLAYRLATGRRAGHRL